MIQDKLQFDFLTTQRIIQKIGQIDQFKGEWKQLPLEGQLHLHLLPLQCNGIYVSCSDAISCCRIHV